MALFCPCGTISAKNCTKSFFYFLIFKSISSEINKITNLVVSCHFLSGKIVFQKCESIIFTSPLSVLNQIYILRDHQLSNPSKVYFQKYHGRYSPNFLLHSYNFSFVPTFYSRQLTLKFYLVIYVTRFLQLFCSNSFLFLTVII